MRIGDNTAYLKPRNAALPQHSLTGDAWLARSLPQCSKITPLPDRNTLHQTVICVTNKALAFRHMLLGKAKGSVNVSVKRDCRTWVLVRGSSQQ